MVLHIDLQSREKRGGYITHSAQLAWPNAGGTPDTVLMRDYMPVMYLVVLVLFYGHRELKLDLTWHSESSRQAQHRLILMV